MGWPCTISLLPATLMPISIAPAMFALPVLSRRTRSSPVLIMQFGWGMTTKRTNPPPSDPRDREPIDEAPETPTDEPAPVPVQDPPVTEPKAPYTVTKDDIKA